jgi:hypothetical protein
MKTVEELLKYISILLNSFQFKYSFSDTIINAISHMSTNI